MMRGPPRRLRDVLQLRRGRPPLRAASAPTRSRRCASSTSSSARIDAPAATRRGRTRSSCSPTTARRRARRSSQRNGYGLDDLVERSLERHSVRRSAAATRTRRPSATRSTRRPAGPRRQRRKAEERRQRPRRRRARLGQPRPHLPHGGAAPADARGDRGAPPASCIAALREHPHIGWLLVRSERHGPLVLGPRRRPLPRRRRVEGEDPLAPLLADGRAAPAAHRRLRARRRHHGRQLLRPGARRGLRVRGADLLPRRPRRPADPAVPPAPRDAARCPTSRSSAPSACTST